MKTKLNMNIEIKLQIEIASIKLKISRTALIKQLLKYFEKDQKKYFTMNKSVQYQDEDLKENWKQFHLTLSEPEYECFFDMRKLCKMSLSYIIALSVEKYLDKLLNPNLKSRDRDKYPDILFPGYGRLWKKTTSGYHFTIFWGYPDKILEGFG